MFKIKRQLIKLQSGEAKKKKKTEFFREMNESQHIIHSLRKMPDLVTTGNMWL